MPFTRVSPKVNILHHVLAWIYNVPRGPVLKGVVPRTADWIRGLQGHPRTQPQLLVTLELKAFGMKWLRGVLEGNLVSGPLLSVCLMTSSTEMSCPTAP